MLYNLFGFFYLILCIFLFFKFSKINIIYNQKKLTTNSKFARQIILYPTLEQESKGGKMWGIIPPSNKLPVSQM